MLRLLTARSLYIALQNRCKHGRALRHPKKEPKKCIPPLLTEKINQWVQTLKRESDAQAVINAHVINNVIFRGFESQPALGDIIQLYLPADTKTCYKHHLSEGVKLSLVINDSSYKCVCTNLNDNVVDLKLLESLITIEDLRQSEIKLTLGNKMEELNSSVIEKFWLEYKDLWKLPGHKNLFMAYRGLPLKFSRSAGRKLKPITKGLNEAQLAAVSKALDPSQPVLCIHGPPGTGKTSVITEIILQMHRNKKKVLMTAPSNRAVDNAVDRIKSAVENRGHHLVMSMRNTQSMSLDNAMEEHPAFADLKELCSQINDYFESDLDRFYGQATHSAQNRRRQIRDELLSSAQVIYSTLTAGTISRLRNNESFPDAVIIDEAGQSLDSASWHAALLAPKVIIVGDQYQLGPAVMNQQNMKDPCVSVSIMDYLSKEFKKEWMVLLREQFRSNDLIMQWPNQEFYEEKLVSNDAVKSITLKDIINPPKDLIIDPMVLVDTLGAGLSFTDRRDGNSFKNEGEAEVIVEHVKALLAAGLEPEKIGVISPYAAQVNLISSMLEEHPAVVVNSVDGFQGGEREVICMSMVRSAPNGVKPRLGFLNNLRRMNVSVTRARRQFFLVANSRTLAADPGLNNLLEHFRKNCVVIQPTDVQKKSRGKKPIFHTGYS